MIDSYAVLNYLWSEDTFIHRIIHYRESAKALYTPNIMFNITIHKNRMLRILPILPNRDSAWYCIMEKPVE